jgi:hypothetical protein
VREEEFNLDRRSILVYGPNGAGKSTICEALEYGLLGNVLEASERRIDPLDSYFRNIYAGRFEVPRLFANSGGQEVQVAADAEHLRFCVIEKNRIDAFARIAARTPAQAEAIIATLFGLGSFSDFVNHFTQNLDTWLRLDTPRARELAERRAALTAAQELIAGADARAQAFDAERELIAAAYHEGFTYRQLAGSLGLEGHPGRLQDLDDVLAQPDPRPTGITVQALLEAHGRVKAARVALAQISIELAARAAEVPFRDLYRAVMELQETSPNACPACSTPLANTLDNPYEKARTGLDALGHLAQLEERRDQRRQTYEAAARALADVAHSVALAGAARDNTMQEVADWIEAGARAGEGVAAIRWRNLLRRCAELEREDQAIQLQLERRRGQRDERDQLLVAKEQVDALGGRRAEHADQLRRAQERVATFNETNAQLILAVEREGEERERDVRIQRAYAGFYDLIRAHRDGLPATLLANLNARTRDLYNEFNVNDPDIDKLAGLRLPVAPGERIRIAFRGSAEDWHDALVVLSEGHIRCLGLAILLAKNIELNLPVVVFDDVVNAIDHDHRNGIRQAIFASEELHDKQLIITCHSNEFIKDIQNQQPPNASYLYVLSPHDGDHQPHVLSGNSRHYLVRARGELADGNLRESLAASRRLLENLAMRMWKALGNQSEELGTLTVSLTKPDGLPETRQVVLELERRMRLGRERNMLAAELWTTRLAGLQEILRVPEASLIWRHLNGGTHDNEDREDFERPLVEQVVNALGRISTTYENG